MNDSIVDVAALVLAAGQSTRMGRPKLTLPWGEGTIISHVLQTLLQGGAKPVILITGGARQAVEAAVEGLPVKSVFNPLFESGEMLSSVQVGLKALEGNSRAALIALGDQPQIRIETVRALIQAYRDSLASIIVPSYQMHRGHPWLAGRELWHEILALRPHETLRYFLDQHARQTMYLALDDPSVVQDLDTPEQYDEFRPEYPS